MHQCYPMHFSHVESFHYIMTYEHIFQTFSNCARELSPILEKIFFRTVQFLNVSLWGKNMAFSCYAMLCRKTLFENTCMSIFPNELYFPWQIKVKFKVKIAHL